MTWRYLGAAAVLPLMAVFVNSAAALFRWLGVANPSPPAAWAGLACTAAWAVWWRYANRREEAADEPGLPRTALAAAVLFSLLVGGSLLPDLRHDWHCHYPITLSILRGNLPVRDLTWPENFLAYHYAFDVLAALPLAAGRFFRPGLHVEHALDATSTAFVFLLLLAVASAVRELHLLSGRGELDSGGFLLSMALLCFGGGLLYLAPLLPDAAPVWTEDRAYGAFHPLLQYVGRRPAVPGFAAFWWVVAMSARAVRSGHWPGAGAGATAAGGVALFLAFTSLDLLAAGTILLAVLAAGRGTRRAFRLPFWCWCAAFPLMLLQGGALTAMLWNRDFSSAAAEMVLRWPFLQGFFDRVAEGRPNWFEAQFWWGLLVDMPITVVLLFWGGTRLMRRAAAEARPLFRSLLLLAATYLVVPLVVQLRHSPQDLHRLFFLPAVLSLVLAPLCLAALVEKVRVRQICAALLLLAMVPGPLHYVWHRTLRPAMKLGPSPLRVAESCIPPELGDQRHRWLISSSWFFDEIMDGHLVLSAPFGSYGRNFFYISPEQHRVWLQGYLRDPLAAGATHGILTKEDLAFVATHGVRYKPVTTVRAFDGTLLDLVQFEP